PAALPSPVYFNLFAKTYAESLGIDYAATMDAIKADMTEIEVPEPRKAKKGKAQPAPQAAPPPPPSAAESFAESAAAEPAAAGRKGRTLVVIGSVAAALVILAGGYFAVTQLLRADSTQPVDASEEARLQTAYRNYNWTVPPYRPSDSLRLRLNSKGDAWTTVFADGDTSVVRNLRPQEDVLISARHRLLVSIAVPSKVTVELNGRPVDLASPETGRISLVEITQANLDSIFTAARPDTADTLAPADSGGAPAAPAPPAGGATP
ncbi:MAG TPA: DUF4115 domain-containing protein, partial [candidate division Zixibacteria bacterium]|nr:DUF4115 domain-containing protein [candidate division Zixibacteria bacterium]